MNPRDCTCLLALDPSSSRTGFAVFRDCELIEAGYFKPPPAAESEQRIEAMVVDLLSLLERVRPARIVIEVPSGRPRAGLKANAGGYLAIYGIAVGELRRSAKEWAARAWRATEPVQSVTEREWTHGMPKRIRQRRIAMLHPRYAAVLVKDSGGDVADAIGLGEWWLGTRRLEDRACIGATQCGSD